VRTSAPGHRVTADAVTRDLVARAVAGDERALSELLHDYLPLIYNIVGRALNGGPDVDDVVQETMIRMVQGLGSLRDPARFRSWLVSIAMRQIQEHGRAQRRVSERQTSLEAVGERTDPGLDFVGASVIQLNLSGQRREVAEATGWLSADDRELLALWWQEVAGTMGRAELAAALDLTTAHAAVRIQRMKVHLMNARTGLRLSTGLDQCRSLETERSSWPAGTGRQTRARIIRHVRTCARCQDAARRLVPPERLLTDPVTVALPA
jgi:RNA polymerase sigma factor (sigma-70 family)